MRFHKTITIILLAVSLFSLTGYLFACGTERWNVKVLADADLAKVNFEAKQTTVSWLVDQPAPLDEGPANHRVHLEFRTFSVKALLIGIQTEEDDDYHLVLADVTNPAKIMIAEIPSPSCGNPDFAKRFNAARKFVDRFAFMPGRRYRRLRHRILVEVTGVAFFDRVHGNRGEALNGIEIHPVLQISKIR